MIDKKTGKAYGIASGFRAELSTINEMEFKSGAISPELAAEAGVVWTELGNHIEAVAAAFMRKMDIAEGDLFINAQNPCWGTLLQRGCYYRLSEMLAENSHLTVYNKEGSVFARKTPMSEWQLIDYRDPADGPELFPKMPIHSVDHLREELDRLRQREPSIVGLENGESGFRLHIGIGGQYAGIKWGEKSDKMYRTVVADQKYHNDWIEFISEGDLQAFWADELIPVDLAIEVIMYFVCQGSRPDWISWKEYNFATRKWEVKPATAEPPRPWHGNSTPQTVINPARA